MLVSKCLTRWQRQKMINSVFDFKCKSSFDSSLSRNWSWSWYSDCTVESNICLVKIVVEGVELNWWLAFVIEPPNTCEDLLVKQSSVWTEECPHSVRSQTLVPGLTPTLHIGVETIGSTRAWEWCHRSTAVYRIIYPGLTYNSLKHACKTMELYRKVMCKYFGVTWVSGQDIVDGFDDIMLEFLIRITRTLMDTHGKISPTKD